MDLADVLVVAVLQGVPARAQLPDGHQEGHDHALGHPLHRVHHAILVVVVTKYFSRVLINDFLLRRIRVVKFSNDITNLYVLDRTVKFKALEDDIECLKIKL